MTADSIRDRLERRQVPLYFLAVIAGFAAAAALPDTTGWQAAIAPALALMLFATFLQLPLARVRASFANRRFIGALVVGNFVAVPALVAPMLPLMPAEPLLRIAILFALLCPCIDYVVTFTHLGKGDSALLLAATPLLLLLQLLLLPLYLGLLLGGGAAALVRPGPFLHAFLVLVLLPMLLAASCRWAAKRSPGLRGAVRAAGLLPVPATALVLFVVVAATAPRLGPALDAALRALPVYLLFAVAAPLAGLALGRAWRLPVAERTAAAFSTATRNSLVVLPLALSVPGALPVVPAVIVAQTLVELAAMPVYVRVLPAIAAAWRGRPAA